MVGFGFFFGLRSNNLGINYTIGVTQLDCLLGVTEPLYERKLGTRSLDHNLYKYIQTRPAA